MTDDSSAEQAEQAPFTAEQQHEIEVVELAIRDLWDLKKGYEQHKAADAKPLNFDALLRQAKYRNQVIDKLSKVKNADIASIALRLAKMDLQGSVHIDDVKARMLGHNRADNGMGGISQAVLNEKIEQAVQQSQAILQQQFSKRISVWKWASSFISILLVLSISLNIQPYIQSMTGEKEILLSGSIQTDTVFKSNNTYILQEPVFVEGKTKLTIEAGATIFGEPGSALIVTRDAQLIAKGRKDAPIVFTSNKPEGQRNRGDWGGLVLLGNAPVNRQGQLEGIDANDPRGEFGGSDPSSNCGNLEYVRVEFAGFETFIDNELNGLTLGACGKETVVRNVQVHKSLDDGIEVFGGTVDLKNILVTGAGDDAFDWDMGWTGRVQFLVVQMHNDDGDNAFEGDNFKQNPDALPRSAPVFYNVTLIGGNSTQTSQRGMTLRRGSGGEFGNILMVGFSRESIDLRGEAIERLTRLETLNFSDLILDQINDGQYFAAEQAEADDDNGFIEADYFSDARLNFKFGIDPRLPAAIYNAYNPEFTPLGHSPARDSLARIPQGEFWDEGANYIGAIRPGTAITWLDGWTQFPSS
ncbi:MAG: hypothetical protein HRU21_00350 [Pseudomonadales bacterium]|nr:hypothetical protein [Pseudomonadales bacterium]